MDIEAIRKRLGYYQKVLQMEEGGVILRCEVKSILEDVNELLEHISHLETEKTELESRLRWKKIGEERPEIGKTVLLRVDPDCIPSLGYYAQFPGTNEFCWKNSIRYVSLFHYPEWREI
jgi:hypothetical protein